MAVNLKILTAIALSFLWLACDDGSKRYMAPSNAVAVDGNSSDAIGSDDVVGGVGNPDSATNNDELGQNPMPPDGANLLVTYQEVVKPIIDSACVNCHNDNNQALAGNLSLASYSQLQTAYGEVLLARISNNANPMPPGASEAVRTDIARLLRNWEAQNFPERAVALVDDNSEEIEE